MLTVSSSATSATRRSCSPLARVTAWAASMIWRRRRSGAMRVRVGAATGAQRTDGLHGDRAAPPSGRDPTGGSVRIRDVPDRAVLRLGGPTRRVAGWGHVAARVVGRSRGPARRARRPGPWALPPGCAARAHAGHGGRRRARRRHRRRHRDRRRAGARRRGPAAEQRRPRPPPVPRLHPGRPGDHGRPVRGARRRLVVLGRVAGRRPVQRSPPRRPPSTGCGPSPGSRSRPAAASCPAARPGT